jgi:hypothetical protein
MLAPAINSVSTREETDLHLELTVKPTDLAAIATTTTTVEFWMVPPNLAKPLATLPPTFVKPLSPAWKTTIATILYPEEVKIVKSEDLA